MSMWFCWYGQVGFLQGRQIGGPFGLQRAAQLLQLRQLARRLGEVLFPLDLLVQHLLSRQRPSSFVFVMAILSCSRMRFSFSRFDASSVRSYCLCRATRRRFSFSDSTSRLCTVAYFSSTVIPLSAFASCSSILASRCLSSRSSFFASALLRVGSPLPACTSIPLPGLLPLLWAALRPTRYAISMMMISVTSAQPTAIGTMSGVSMASQSLAIENLPLYFRWNASSCSLVTVTVCSLRPAAADVRFSCCALLQW
uniref:Uncharacterized protein n=1 Tax=Anopheles coluzzii TaxID=1518534 RepID=A0A8W7PJS6_ANOCL